MYKRVLLVDHSTQVLETFAKCIKKLEPEWIVDIAQSGKEALNQLRTNPYNIILSDMNIQDMDGPTLLKKVRTEFPYTARFIHAGPAELNDALKSVNVAHQYLLKPYPPKELVKCIHLAITEENLQQLDRLRDAIMGLDNIPSIPKLYIEIKDTFDDPHSNIQDIGTLIGKDPGMTAKILKLVNSAFFGHSQRITNPAEAAAYLGIELIKTLVLSLHIFDQYEEEKLKDFNLPGLWEYSMRVAQTARMIAQMEKTNRSMQDEAFTAGLLHDMGQLVLITNFTSDYRSLCNESQMNPVNLIKAEKERFGIDHAEVGAFLMQLWGIPSEIVQAIRYHHNPSDAQETKFSALTAIHSASMLLGSNHPITTANASGLQTIDMDYLEKLNLENRLPEWAEIIVD
ncbi:MAG: response regulator [Verrucomicrobiota bacterium]